MRLLDIIERQIEFSRKTFGPHSRLEGVLDHIEEELDEVRKAPKDPSEWADIIILAIDGAWRQGIGPATLVASIVAKQTKNENRTWPDWRTADRNKAIKHVKRNVEERDE